MVHLLPHAMHINNYNHCSTPCLIYTDCCARPFRLSQGSKVHHSSMVIIISAETVCINFVQVVRNAATVAGVVYCQKIVNNNVIDNFMQDLEH